MNKKSPAPFRLPARGALVALPLSTAMFGAVTAGATGAHALLPPFHCKQTPQGQDCTNGGDGGGGGGAGWSAPAWYMLVTITDTGNYVYERSDGLDATNMDSSSVQSSTGLTCHTGMYISGDTTPVVCH